MVACARTLTATRWSSADLAVLSIKPKPIPLPCPCPCLALDLPLGHAPAMPLPLPFAPACLQAEPLPCPSAMRKPSPCHAKVSPNFLFNFRVRVLCCAVCVFAVQGLCDVTQACFVLSAIGF